MAVPDRRITGQPDLPARVAEDIAGVQGTEADQAGRATPHPAPPDKPEDRPPPDAGEIEWAGTVVKKPPHPDADGA